MAALMTIAGIIIVLLGIVAGVSIWHLVPALTELKGLRLRVESAERTRDLLEEKNSEWAVNSQKKSDKLGLAEGEIKGIRVVLLRVIAKWTNVAEPRADVSTIQVAISMERFIGMRLESLIRDTTGIGELRDLVDKRTKQFVDADNELVLARDKIEDLKRELAADKQETQGLVVRVRDLEMGHNSLQLELDSTRAKLACEKEARVREAGIWKDDQNRTSEKILGHERYIKELEETLLGGEPHEVRGGAGSGREVRRHARGVVDTIQNLIAPIQPAPVEDAVAEKPPLKIHHTGSAEMHVGSRWAVEVDLEVGDKEPPIFRVRKNPRGFCRNGGAGREVHRENIENYLFYRPATKEEIDAHFWKVMRPLHYRYSRAAGDPDLKAIENEILAETAKFEEHPDGWGLPCHCGECKSSAEPG